MSLHEYSTEVPELQDIVPEVHLATVSASDTKSCWLTRSASDICSSLVPENLPPNVLD